MPRPDVLAEVLTDTVQHSSHVGIDVVGLVGYGMALMLWD
jgi:hypothetical protein